MAISKNVKLLHWPFTGGRALGVTFGTAKMGLSGPQPAQAHPRCTKCNSPTINGQCASGCAVLMCPLKG